MKKKASLLLVLSFVACSSSETTTSSPGDGGTIDPSEQDAGATIDSSSPSPIDSGAPPNDAASEDTGAPPKAGSCASPKTVIVPFSEPSGSTAGALDTTSVACGAPSPRSEAVYRVVLANDAAVKITANDESGQGIGVQVREDSCTGTSVECGWQPNGVYDKLVPLPAGTWLFIVERNPEGAFSFALTEQ